jgi:hypothetical protein
VLEADKFVEVKFNDDPDKGEVAVIEEGLNNVVDENGR